MGAAKYFEEFELGETVTSRSRTIDGADIKMFSACTSLCSRIQTDAAYCAGIPGLGAPAVAGSHSLLRWSVRTGSPRFTMAMTMWNSEKMFTGGTAYLLRSASLTKRSGMRNLAF